MVIACPSVIFNVSLLTTLGNIKTAQDRIMDLKLIRTVFLLFFSAMIFFLTNNAFGETIEAKGRIKWEMLKIEKKRLEIEEKKLRLEMTKLEVGACEQMSDQGTGERVACVKRAMSHLTISSR